MSEFIGKVVLVTGSTSGLGKAIAVEFAQRGANVVINGRREKDGLEVVEEINKINKGKASFYQCDISIEDNVRKLLEYTIATFGKLDYAINNAAISGEIKKLMEYSSDEYHRVIAVNLHGTFYCMKYEIPELLKTKGAIVNISSTSGLRGKKYGISPYSASKHGIIGLTKCAALEYAAEGIRINAVCPGAILTETYKLIYKGSEDPEEAIRQRMNEYPMQRLPFPDEIARSVIWLCSKDTSFITGSTISVDGGITAQ